MIACVVSINERVFHRIFFPHIGDNVGVVINVRKEIKKFGKKVRNPTSQTAANDLLLPISWAGWSFKKAEQAGHMCNTHQGRLCSSVLRQNISICGPNSFKIIVLRKWTTVSPSQNITNQGGSTKFYWSEIIFVVSNHTSGISDQITPYSVQLPLQNSPWSFVLGW